MFIVYTPEGRNSIGVKYLKPELKVTPVPKSPDIGDTEFDQLNLEVEQAESSKKTHQKAIDQYQSVKETEHGQPLVRVGEIMTSPVVTIGEAASMIDAWNLMAEHDIHHLPVLNDQGILVGIISFLEILKRAIVGLDGQLEEIKDERIAQFMQREVVTTNPSMDIRKVAMVMTNYGIGSMVIVDQASGALLGMVTFSDLVRRLAEEPPITIYA
ncbi:MAG: CBS domain-containing protein [Hydrogenovibrio sp.]|nr:CBS domain-containing protein [Hydrogenovibrio sp.]